LGSVSTRCGHAADAQTDRYGALVVGSRSDPAGVGVECDAVVQFKVQTNAGMMIERASIVGPEQIGRGQRPLAVATKSRPPERLDVLETGVRAQERVG